VVLLIYKRVNSLPATVSEKGYDFIENTIAVALIKPIS
jgi:hypothetical protein